MEAPIIGTRDTTGRELRFYYPLPRFPSVSVTGGHCGLGCKHCQGHYLQHMPNVDTPDKLRSFCVELESRGGVGVLVSGGSTTRGRVPLEPFLPTLRWVKDNTGLIVNIHSGLLDRREAEGIAATGVDIASIDIVGSEQTIRQVYGLDATVEDYWDTLRFLREGGITNIAPHICVGLHFGKLQGEFKAIEVASGIDPEVIVLLGLIPTPDTPMEDVPPPSVEDIIRIITAVREASPDTSIALGCMRSRGDKDEMDWRAIEAGADRIALASRSTVKRAEGGGFTVKVLDGCCATPISLEDRLLRF